MQPQPAACGLDHRLFGRAMLVGIGRGDLLTRGLNRLDQLGSRLGIKVRHCNQVDSDGPDGLPLRDDQYRQPGLSAKGEFYYRIKTDT